MTAVVVATLLDLLGFEVGLERAALGQLVYFLHSRAAGQHRRQRVAVGGELARGLCCSWDLDLRREVGLRHDPAPELLGHRRPHRFERCHSPKKSIDGALEVNSVPVDPVHVLRVVLAHRLERNHELSSGSQHWHPLKGGGGFLAGVTAFSCDSSLSRSYPFLSFLLTNTPSFPRLCGAGHSWCLGPGTPDRSQRAAHRTAPGPRRSTTFGRCGRPPGRRTASR